MEDNFWVDVATEEMLALRGQVVTIKYYNTKYNIAEDGGAFNWTDEMLTPIIKITKTKPITQGENNVLDSDKTPR